MIDISIKRIGHIAFVAIMSVCLTLGFVPGMEASAATPKLTVSDYPAYCSARAYHGNAAAGNRMYSIDGRTTYCMEIDKNAHDDAEYTLSSSAAMSKVGKYVLYMGWPNCGSDNVIAGHKFGNSTKGDRMARQATQLALWLVLYKKEAVTVKWNGVSYKAEGGAIASTAKALAKAAQKHVDDETKPWGNGDPGYKAPVGSQVQAPQGEVKNIDGEYWSVSGAINLNKAVGNPYPAGAIRSVGVSLKNDVEGGGDVRLSTSNTTPNSPLSSNLSLYSSGTTVYLWAKLYAERRINYEEGGVYKWKQKWIGGASGSITVNGYYEFEVAPDYTSTVYIPNKDASANQNMQLAQLTKGRDFKTLDYQYRIRVTGNIEDGGIRPPEPAVAGKSVDVEVIKDTIKRTSSALTSEVGDNVAHDKYDYTVNFRSKSSTKATEFVVEDNLDMVNKQGFRVEAIWTPKVWGNLQDYLSDTHTDTTVKPADITPAASGVWDLGGTTGARVMSGEVADPYAEYAKLYIKVEDAGGNYVRSAPATSVLSWQQKWVSGPSLSAEERSQSKDADPILSFDDKGQMDAGQINRHGVSISAIRPDAGWNFVAYIKSDEPQYFPVISDGSHDKGIVLKSGEYISAIRIDYGAVDIGFTSMNGSYTDVNDGATHDWTPNASDAWYQEAADLQKYDTEKGILFADQTSVDAHVAKIAEAKDLSGLRYIVSGTQTLMPEVSANGLTVTDPAIINSVYAFIADASCDTSRPVTYSSGGPTATPYIASVAGVVLTADDIDAVVTRVVPTVATPTPAASVAPGGITVSAFGAVMRQGEDTAYMIAKSSVRSPAKPSTPGGGSSDSSSSGKGVLSLIKTGEGSLVAMVAGIALIAAAIMLIIYMRSRKKKRFHKMPEAPLCFFLTLALSASMLIYAPAAFALGAGNIEQPTVLIGVQKTFCFTAKGDDMTQYIPEIPTKYALAPADFGGELPAELAGEMFTLSSSSISAPYPYQKIHEKRHYITTVTAIADSTVGLASTMGAVKVTVPSITQDLSKEGTAHEIVMTTYSGVLEKVEQSEKKTPLAMEVENIVTMSAVGDADTADVDGLPDTKIAELKTSGDPVLRDGKPIDGWAKLSDIDGATLLAYTSDAGIMYHTTPVAMSRQHISVDTKGYEGAEWVSPPQAWQRDEQYVGIESYLDVSKSLTSAEYTGTLESDTENTWLYAVTAVYLPDNILTVPKPLLDEYGENSWVMPDTSPIEVRLDDVPLTAHDIAGMHNELAGNSEGNGGTWYVPVPIDVGGKGASG